LTNLAFGYCSDNTLLQVAQKRGSAIDKPKQGTTGTDIDSIRTAILEEAAIVFATLSFSGSALLAKSNRGFDVVIIDEAAQAVSPFQ
jgi:senataxin